MPLGACFLSNQNTRVTSDYVDLVKNVGVISLVRAQPNISHLSTSAMESAFASAQVAGWQSDVIVYDAIESRLRRKGFTVRRLAPNAALQAARSSDWRSPTGDSVAADIYALGASAGFDMVVVVQDAVDDDFVTDTNQRVRGYGVQKAFDTEAFLYAAIYVQAFDIGKQFVVGGAGGRQVEAAPAGAWSPAFEQTKGVIDPGRSWADSVAAPLANLLRNAVAIAATEAGL